MSESLQKLVEGSMKQAYLVRHAESTSNVGAPIQDFAKIPLSVKGEEDSKIFADVAPEADRLIVSPFLRAQQTAEPLKNFARARGDRRHTWLVQECTYMDTRKFVGTTQGDWKPYVDAYWERADPNYQDCPNTESYRGFTHRARHFLQKLADARWRTSLVVTHSMFMTVIVWNILNGWPEPTQQSMWDFRAFELAYKPKNLCVLPIFESAGPQGGWLVGGVWHPLEKRNQK